MGSQSELSWFDRMASAASRVTAKAWFFALCALIVCIWAPTILLIGNVDTWQLIINTTTTIITFLLVALLQNTQFRDMQAVHKKLNALVEAQADLMKGFASQDPSMPQDVKELRESSGVEEREGT